MERVRSFDTLRVNVLVADDEVDRFHVDTLDLYSARARAGFVMWGVWLLTFGLIFSKSGWNCSFLPMFTGWTE